MEQTLITDNFTLIFMLLSLALLVLVVIYITCVNRQSEKPDMVKKAQNKDLEMIKNGDNHIKSSKRLTG